MVQGDLLLRAIYVLDVAAQPCIETLGPQDALVELVRHSYGARLLEGTNTVAEHLRQVAGLDRIMEGGAASPTE